MSHPSRGRLRSADWGAAQLLTGHFCCELTWTTRKQAPNLGTVCPICSFAFFTALLAQLQIADGPDQRPLRSEGQIIKAGRHQDVCQMHPYDGQGKLVGHATGTFIVLPDVKWE
jgi:hypothetical protein